VGYIFVDESGRINLVQKKGCFIVSYLFCNDPKALRSAMTRQLMRMHIYGKYPEKIKELKFYPQWKRFTQLGYNETQIAKFKKEIHDVRIQTIHLISNYCDGFFITILDNKTVREPSWDCETIGNYVIKQPLIYDFIPRLPLVTSPTVCFDKGRLIFGKMENFYSYLSYDSSTTCNFQETNSITEPCIWAADMISGAFYHKFQNKDSSYFDLISHKLIENGIKKYWNT
jgi:hypothetical protein